MPGCPENGLLKSFVQGALPDEARTEVERHVRDCPACRGSVEIIKPVVVETAPTVRRPPIKETVRLSRGSPVGRYLVIDQLGEGGMGVVYSAFDPGLGRSVALKLMREPQPGADPDDARARLLREGQAIAQVSHPNVVAVHDIGTVDGQVFLAMELLEGGTLREWLKKPRSWREVLAVFTAAGQGLAAAHRAALIHRDFKPENVLFGKDGRPRVTDFGLARYAGAEAVPLSIVPVASTPLKPRRRITQPGTVMGTPWYMAPEQLAGLETDARTDQYSFCVVLWEALFRSLPYSPPPGAPPPEWRLNEPPKDIACPAWLRRALQRGLNVVPSQRFPSTDELLAALEIPRRRRRKWALGIGAATVALAAVGFAGAVSQRSARLCAGAAAEAAQDWNPASQEQLHKAFLASGRADSEDSFTFTRRGLDAFFIGWAAMRQEACEATRVRGVQSDGMLGLRMACLDRRRAEARALLALLSRPDAEVVAGAAQAARSLPSLRSCADLELLTAKVAPPTAEQHPKVDEASRQVDQARALFAAGKYKDGLAAAGTAVGAAAASGYLPVQAEARLLLGRLQEHTGDLKGAEATLLRALADAEASGQDELAAGGMGQLARLLGARQLRFGEAHAWGALAEAKAQRQGGQDQLRAELLRAQALVLEAEQHLPEAVEGHRRALALRQRLDPESLEISQSLHELASALRSNCQPHEALAAYEGALAVREKLLGPDSDLAAVTRNGLANLLMSLGRFEEALQIYRRVQGTLERVLGPQHFRVAVATANIGVVYYAQGRFAEALPYFERAAAIREAAFGKESPKVADSWCDLSELLIELGRYPEAKAKLEQARAILDKLPADHPSQVEYATQLGKLLVAQGSFREAVEPLERALKAGEGKKGMKVDATGARARFLLAKALWSTPRERARAQELARQARESYSRCGSQEFRYSQAEIDAWLAAHPVAP